MNVIPFRMEKPQPEALVLPILIDPNAKLEEGHLIACSFMESDHVMIWTWYGPTGKDGNGRFVKKGDPRETFATDVFRYSQRNIDDGVFKVLGKVIAGVGPAQPCPKMWRDNR